MPQSHRPVYWRMLGLGFHNLEQKVAASCWFQHPYAHGLFCRADKNPSRAMAVVAKYFSPWKQGHTTYLLRHHENLCMHESEITVM